MYTQVFLVCPGVREAGGHLAENPPRIALTLPGSTSPRAPNGSRGASGLNRNSGSRPARHRAASSLRACRGACARCRRASRPRARPSRRRAY
eukprot:8068329-Pyramimonas_sp.AAC.1